MITVRTIEIKTKEGKEILQPISFGVKPGEILGVYGPNGSGKSSLLKAIAGLPTEHFLSGVLTVDELPFPGALTAEARVEKILYLGSDFRTSFDLSVRELFEMGALVGSRFMQDIGSKERRRMNEVVERLQIFPFLPRFFRTLSDGEKQLVMFARALIQSTRFLILDETFSKLDLDKLVLVSRVIREEARTGRGFLIASHDLNFLSEVSDDLLFIKQGAFLGKGPIQEMLTPAKLDELYPSLSLQVVTSPETGKWKILY